MQLDTGHHSYKQNKLAGSIYSRRSSSSSRHNGKITSNRSTKHSASSEYESVRTRSYSNQKVLNQYHFMNENSVGNFSAEVARYSANIAELSQIRHKMTPMNQTNSLRELKNLVGYSNDCAVSDRLNQNQARYVKMLASYEEKKKTINDELAKMRSQPKGQTHLNLKKNIILTAQFSSNPEEPKMKREKKTPKNLEVFWIALERQIEYDTKTRELKQRVASTQLEQVKKGLNSLGVTFQFSNDEMDPYCAPIPTPTSELTKFIYLSHQSAEQFWKGQLEHKFSVKEIEAIFQLLDFQKKGRINFDNFIREVGLALGKHLRNRDVYQIYCRMSGSVDKPLSRVEFVKALTIQ